MRFALATQFDYNILDQRPHFPGYPVFCLVAKLIYFFTGSIQYTFSIVGSISILILIYFSRKISDILYYNKNFFLIFLIFVNPLFWILSNRYMSDLFGLSVLTAICYYFLKSLDQKNKENLFFAFFVIGILLGIRTSFLPFLFPLIIYFFIKDIKYLFYFILFAFLGVLIWLVPLVSMTNPIQLYNLAINDISGHFNVWGGTIISSDSNIINRIYKTFESIWADGFGAWWPGRNLITLVPSIGICLFIFNGLRFVKENKIKKKYYLILACMITYFIWIIFFQNVVYKPRHVIPFLPFIIILMDIGFQTFIKSDRGKIISIIFCLTMIIVVGNLAYQHKYKKTAINQMKEVVTNYKAPQKVFYSSKLMRDYIDSHINDYGYLEKYSNSTKNNFTIRKRYNENFIIFSTIKLDPNFFYLIDKKIFFHNPYINRLWSTVYLYIYSKSELVTE